MPINEYPTEYTDEDLVAIYEAPYEAPKSEPFETELRSRLHDILEQWEEEANKFEDPAQVYAMLDQISDALYPPEDAE